MLRILSCRYSDISLEAFSVDRTFGHNSEWFVIVLAAVCLVLSRYLPYQTVSCFRGHFQGLYCKQLWLVKIIVISLLICLKLLSLKFQSFPRRPSFRCLFSSKAITFEPICGSDASSKCFFTRVAFVGVDLLILPFTDSWTNEYEWSKISHWGQKLRLNSYHIETYFNKLQFFLGLKFTSAAEDWGFYWLIRDSRC